MAVVSVDLAYKDYQDIGVAVLADSPNGISCEFIQLQVRGIPTAENLSLALVNLCMKYDSNILLMDGPQGWRADDGAHVHSRDCERKLNTPAKTGPPSIVKPASYTPFVSFSISVFDGLTMHGWSRLSGDRSRIDLSKKWAIESFPLAAWGALGIRSLPAKSQACEEDLRDRLKIISGKFGVMVSRSPNHDELQALVAGLVGIWLARRDFRMISAVGLPPRIEIGTWREGFILVPSIQSRLGSA